MATILSEQKPAVTGSGGPQKPVATSNSNNSNTQAPSLATGAGKFVDALHGDPNPETIAREKAAHDARIRVARNTGSDVSQYQRDARRAVKMDGKSQLETDTMPHEQKKSVSIAHSHAPNVSSFKNVTGHIEEIGKFKKTMLHQKSLKNVKEPEVQIFTGLPDETLKAMEAN